MQAAGVRVATAFDRAVYAPIARGLTAIYGRNGSGKTRLLTSMANALSGSLAPSVDRGIDVVFLDSDSPAAIVEEVARDVHGIEPDEIDPPELAQELDGMDLVMRHRFCANARSLLALAKSELPAGASLAVDSPVALQSAEALSVQGSIVTWHVPRRVSEGTDDIDVLALGVHPDHMPAALAELLDGAVARLSTEVLDLSLLQGRDAIELPVVIASLWSDYRAGRLPDWAGIPLVETLPLEVTTEREMTDVIMRSQVVSQQVSLLQADRATPKALDLVLDSAQRVVKAYDSKEAGDTSLDGSVERQLLACRNALATIESHVNRHLVNFLGDDAPA